jgi:hypothetical protein
MGQVPTKTAPAADAVPPPEARPAADAPEVDPATSVVVASHEVLFVDAIEPRCDACGEPLVESEDGDGYGFPGRGVYMWSRGDETRFESVPLCASCASAIGMTALARWEIEEEEG